jgi:hypothetical protein
LTSSCLESTSRSLAHCLYRDFAPDGGTADLAVPPTSYFGQGGSGTLLSFCTSDGNSVGVSQTRNRRRSQTVVSMVISFVRCGE